MESTVTVNAHISHQTSQEVEITVKMPLVRSMLSGEDVIQEAVNAVGMLGTTALLKTFDTDGSPIAFGAVRFTSKGQVQKDYESPYGKVAIERHVYQGAKGGDTFCPLDYSARIIRSATPKLAKMVANKYTSNSADEVKVDLSSNHHRHLSRGHIQAIADHVGDMVISKEASWHYAPDIGEPVTTVSIGIDGAMMLMREDGYREAMSGRIAYYAEDGKRLHTDYIAAAPEYGKKTFLARMTREIENIKNRYPDASYVGIADRASSNGSFFATTTLLLLLEP